MTNSAPARLYAAHVSIMAERSRLALDAGGYQRLLIHAGRARTRFLDDREDPFSVNPHFKAWLPLLRHPDCWLIVTPGERPRLLYHQPVDYWFLPPADPSGYWVEHFDIKVIRRPDEARSSLRGERAAVIGELPTELRDWQLGDVNPPAVLASLHYDRAVKTGYELECMRRATSRAVAGHRAAEHAFREGASEYEIHLAYCRACSHTEEELPYDSIVAINEHGAVLHYQGRDREPVAQPARRALLIDAGAGYAGYAADITRTWSYRDDAFADLAAGVDTLQQRICQRVRAGVDYRELHLGAHRDIAAVLVDFGLIGCSADAAVERGLTRRFFPHGLGHFIGLQVHDVAGLQADRGGGEIARPEGHPFLRLTRRLEPDQVTTIEPGLYFIEPLLAELRGSPEGRDVRWNRVEAFAPCGGVRVEDDVRILPDGHENLTREAFAAT